MDELLTPFAKENGIGLINASPLHMGVLTEKDPPEWHPSQPEVKLVGRRVVELCQQRGVNVADVALRYCVDHPYAATTLVGMSRPDHVKRNIRGIESPAATDLLSEIREIAEPVAKTTWVSGRPENNDYVEMDTVRSLT